MTLVCHREEAFFSLCSHGGRDRALIAAQLHTHPCLKNGREGRLGFRGPALWAGVWGGA